MINLGTTILIAKSGAELEACIRQALGETADALLKAYDLVGVDLANAVSTKTNREATFPKFIKLGVLKQSEELGKDYLLAAYDAYLAGNTMTPKQFCGVTKCESSPGLEYRRSIVQPLRTGIGLFFVSLHCKKALTLPSNFIWPVSRVRNSGTGRAEKFLYAESPLLSFVRSIESSPGTGFDVAFASIGRSQKRISWYSTYATKALLSTGWHAPEDVKLSDLAKLREAEEGRITDASSPCAHVQRALIDTISRKFGARCPITMVEWPRYERAANFKRGATKVEEAALAARTAEGDAELVAIIAKMLPSSAYPEQIDTLRTIFGWEVDDSNFSRCWIDLQILYMRKVRRENYKGTRTAIGLFNLYLFVYLPHWFQRHSDFSIPFPDTPNKLVGSIFVSRLQVTDMATPATLVDFLEARWKSCGISNEAQYGYMKQLEKFFQFIVDYGHELTECSNFRQPISKFDYPPIRSSTGTNKRAFPRRLYSLFIPYVEAVKSYIDLAIKKAFAKEIGQLELYWLVKYSTRSIDTHRQEVRAIMGESPSVTVDGQVIPIRYLPYFPTTAWLRLTDGTEAKIPRPHPVNQILVALYTGLRHNHIQWLDADIFDQLVRECDVDYTRLLVNTDKVRKKIWSPDVNFRVIEILRDQLEWRNRIAEEGFDIRHFYNDNEETEYPRFRPLFSYSPESGLPHNDTIYQRAWDCLLIGFQTWVNTHLIAPSDQPVKFCRLTAPGVDFIDRNESKKLKKYATWQKPFCQLKVASDTSPHSSRVSVITHLIHFLPPELIGKRITGQHVGTVAYYVRPSPEDLEEEAIHQALDMQRRALENHVNGFLKGESDISDPMIKASAINSRLAKSMKTDVGQTIARYGCMSVMIGDAADSGLDLLSEMGASRIAYNTTEICPYNNTCPAHIVKHINGMRRCALCPAAVRSIDHLPAVAAAKKQCMELLGDLDKRIDALESSGKYTDRDLDDTEGQRQRIGEELAGWQLCEAVLEVARARLAESPPVS